MKISTCIILIIIIGIALNAYQPNLYQSTYGLAVDKVQSSWNERGSTEVEDKPYQDITNGSSLISPNEGTNFGQPWDEVINRFDCNSDSQCKTRFSVYALCNTDTGECYQGATE